MRMPTRRRRSATEIFTHFIIQGISEGKAVSDGAEFVDIHSLCVYTSTSIDEFYADLGQETVFPAVS